MDKIKVGVVGCGVLGSRHAEIYNRSESAELVAVCDHRIEKAKRLAEKFGIPAYDSLDAFSKNLQAASICTPAVSHHQVSRPLLQSGIHLLIEKPITTKLEDVDDLLNIAKQKKLILQVGHIERFNGAVQAIKKIVKYPEFIECARIGFFDPRISDVGVVLDLMIHDIDILLYLVDAPVKSIHAVGMNILSSTEDFANCRLLFENGTVCNLTASRMAQKHRRKIRIFEKHRYISLDYFGQEAVTFSKDSANTSETIYHPIDIRKTNPLEEEVKDFLNCVGHNKKPKVAGETGRAALAVALQILDQIQVHS